MFARKTPTPFTQLAEEIRNPAVRKALGKDAFWHAVKNREFISLRQLEQRALVQARSFQDRGMKEEAAESYYLTMAACGKGMEETGQFSMTAIVSVLKTSFDLYLETGNKEGAIRAGKLLSESKMSESDHLEIYDKAAYILGTTIELLKDAKNIDNKDEIIDACRKKMDEFSAKRDTQLLGEVRRMILREEITQLKDAETMLVHGIDKETRLQEALKLVRELWQSMHWLD